MQAARARATDPAKPSLTKTPRILPEAPPAKATEAPNRTPRMPGEDRRRQLLRVAIDSFARNGFSGTKTKDIAAAAGVSEAILFRHFVSKEDLYHAILDEKEATMGGERWFVEMNELAERRDDRGEAFGAIAGSIRTEMRVDVVDLSRRGNREIAVQQPERLTHDRRILASQIDQVRGMDDATLNPCRAAHLRERGKCRWIKLCDAIAARVARENLHCIAAERLGIVNGLCIAAGNADVDAEIHGLNFGEIEKVCI